MNTIARRTRSLSACCALLLPLLHSAPAGAEGSQEVPLFAHPWRFRLHGSAGIDARAGENESAAGYSSGLQVVLPANQSQGYGLGIDYVRVGDRRDQRYLALGLLIEQRLLGALALGIGAFGYLPLENERPVPFGLSAKIGFAPDWGPISPYVSLRSDQILAAATVELISLSLGVTLALEP